MAGVKFKYDFELHSLFILPFLCVPLSIGLAALGGTLMGAWAAIVGLILGVVLSALIYATYLKWEQGRTGEKHDRG